MVMVVPCAERPLLHLIVKTSRRVMELTISDYVSTDTTLAFGLSVRFMSSRMFVFVTTVRVSRR